MTIKDVIAKIETSTMDLLDHNTSEDLNLRILNTLSGSSLMCIILRETGNSFLVGLPCKLIAYREKQVVEQYMSVNFIRVPISSLLAIVPCFGEFEEEYIGWLIENGQQLFPRVITDDYKGRLIARRKRIKEELEIVKSSAESIASKDDEEDSSSTIMALPESNTRH